MKRTQRTYSITPSSNKRRRTKPVNNPIPLTNFNTYYRKITQVKFSGNPKNELKQIKEYIDQYKGLDQAAHDQFSKIDEIYHKLKTQVGLLDKNLLTKDDVSKQLENKWEEELKFLLLMKKEKQGNQYRVCCAKPSQLAPKPYTIEIEPSSSLSSSLSLNNDPVVHFQDDTSNPSLQSSSSSSTSSAASISSSTLSSSKSSILKSKSSTSTPHQKKNSSSSTLSAFNFANRRPSMQVPLSSLENHDDSIKNDDFSGVHIAAAADVQEMEEKPNQEELDNRNPRSDVNLSIHNDNLETNVTKCDLCNISIESKPVHCNDKTHIFHEQCFRVLSYSCPLHKCCNPECNDPRLPAYLCLACKSAYHGEGGERKCIPPGSSIFDAYIKCGKCYYKVYPRNGATKLMVAYKNREIPMTEFERHRLVSDNTVVFCGHCNSEIRFDDSEQHLGTEFTLSVLEKNRNLTGIFSLSEEEEEKANEETPGNASTVVWVMNIPPNLNKDAFDKKIPQYVKSKIVRSWRSVYLRFNDKASAMNVYTNLKNTLEEDPINQGERYHLRVFFQKTTHVLFATNLNDTVTEPIITNQFTKGTVNSVFISRSPRGKCFARIVFETPQDAMDEWIEQRTSVVLGHEWVLRPYKHDQTTTKSSILKFWNIHPSMTENEFYELIQDKPHKKIEFSHTASFVMFSDSKIAETVMREYNARKFNGKALVIDYATQTEMKSHPKTNTNPTTMLHIPSQPPAGLAMPPRPSNRRPNENPPEIQPLRRRSTTKKPMTSEERKQKRLHNMRKCDPRECVFCK